MSAVVQYQEVTGTLSFAKLKDRARQVIFGGFAWNQVHMSSEIIGRAQEAVKLLNLGVDSQIIVFPLQEEDFNIIVLGVQLRPRRHAV